MFCHDGGHFATAVAVMPLVGTGSPRTSRRGELVRVVVRVLWQWEGFVGMSLVHPNGSARPWVPWCGYSALPLQSVFNLSIATSSVMGISS